MTPAPKRQKLQQTSSIISPPSRRGGVYCLPSFISRAEQWYKQETSRQTGVQVPEGATRGGPVRRQPSRTAKTKQVAEGPYVLSGDEVKAWGVRVVDQDRGATPPPERVKASNSTEMDWDMDQVQDRAEMKDFDYHIHVASFCTRLSKAIYEKTNELKARYEPKGIRHICTVANSEWQCLDEVYCGHGLVKRCVGWVPKGSEHLKRRVQTEMEEYVAAVFSMEAGGDRSAELKELKGRKYAKLKEQTLVAVAEIEKEESQRPSAMEYAMMLETPTLGRWPARGFVREDVEVQTVAFAGLLFAVDVCQGETRLMML